MQGLKDLSELETSIGYKFKNRKLLERAMTHRSFSIEHNERLEFLGDSVLNCVMGYTLFLRDRHFNEGELSRVRANLVCEKTLAVVGRELGISDYLLMGDGEVKMGGRTRPSIIADAMEALFGAVFSDSGFESAAQVILRQFEPILSSLTPEQLSKDAKTRLQEFLQGQKYSLPEYHVVSVTGAAHNQVFECECHVVEKQLRTRGKARNRRGAEQAAAQLMLSRLGAPVELIQEDAHD